MQPSTTGNVRPVDDSLPASSKPEWVRVPDATRLFGISRSSLYELIAEGQIKSTCLKKRGALRGIRLISYDSIANYIEAAASESMTAKMPRD